MFTRLICAWFKPRGLLRWAVGWGLNLSVGWLSLIAIGSPANAAGPRRSGFEDMQPATQAMQRDDGQNPAMLWVLKGERYWQQKPGANLPACMDCHAQAPNTMRGVAARYPAWSTSSERPISLSQRVNQCRQSHQQQPAWTPESEELLALTAYLGLQSRGMAIAPPNDPRLAPFAERGRQLFLQRIGQLNLSCAQCHDERAGQLLGGAVIVQGHPTAYPLYRLEWQTLGSLERRVRACMTGVRATPLAFNSVAMTELELYLMQRAMGLSVETPGVRP